MADNKDKKVLNVPALRFPEFSGEWENLRLSDFATKITKKNKGNIVKNILCNSANLGLVPQGNYFDREIANTENTDGYYVICNGDFVYNPRKSTAAPFGPVNIYEGEDAGIISPLYLCFSIHNIFPKFLYYRFKSSAWHSYVYSHGDSGVRFDRVSIKDDVFFDMPVYKPAQDEQIKIATILQLIDERIATQNKIIEKYESLIQAIIYKAKMDGISKGTWRKIDLYEVLQERNEKNVEGRTICSVSVSQGVVNQIEYLGRSFAAKQTSHYNVVKYGDIVYTKSPTGDFPYGIIKRSDIRQDVAVSPLYGVYIPANDSMGVILHFYFMQPCNAFNYLHPLIQKGAKNTINISNGRFLENSVPLPVSESEANTIAVMLKSVQAKIEIEKKLLQSYAKGKEYLLHQMFI